MKDKPRLLFVSHAATRNGATILLLSILRWLNARNQFRIEILVNGSGDLLDEFRAIGRTTVWRNPAFFLAVLPQKIRARWQPRIESLALRLVMSARSYDLVYINTSAVWRHVPILAKRSRHLLWHIHEMSFALRLTMGEDRIRRLFPLASRFVVVSQAVREVMQCEFDVAPGRMDLVPGFVSLPETGSAERLACRLRILEQLGWPKDSFVVGGCGAMGWRKGTDLFLQIARLMCNRAVRTPVRFLWVGGQSDGAEALQFGHDVRSFGLVQHCTCIPTTGNVNDYYNTMDVFALTSREDPFPLVMLEAGACHVPTVCFAGAGGGAEYVGLDAGLVAPYLDLPAFMVE